MYIYRDSRVFERGFVLWVLVVYALILLFGLGMIAPVPVDPSITWAAFAAFIAFVFGAAYVEYRSYTDATCGEIVLSDEGTCVLKTRRRVIRLDVNEIRSVQYSCDGEGEQFYTIHYEGGTLLVSELMPGLLDFLRRLNRLNPAVDLTSFPRDSLPFYSAPATGKPPLLRRFIRSPFPLFIGIYPLLLLVERL
jgi:hypothetical protein